MHSCLCQPCSLLLRGGAVCAGALEVVVLGSIEMLCVPCEFLGRSLFSKVEQMLV